MRKHGNASLSTQCFAKYEVENLIEEIKNLGITDCGISKENEEQYVINIYVHSYFDFIELIRSQLSDLPNALEYKVDSSKYRSKYKSDTPFFAFDGFKYQRTHHT